MGDLFVVATGAAACLLWQLAQARPAPAVSRMLTLATMRPGAMAQEAAWHHWPALGRYEFGIVDAQRHQAALQAALQESGALCMASLHTGKLVGEPVEVRVNDRRVGFLSDGDGTRFQRRLAYEAQPGQTSLCGARIEVHGPPGREVYSIVLDLKPFRH